MNRHFTNDRSKLKLFQLRCGCGFKTDSVAVGYVDTGPRDTEDEAWRVARFNNVEMKWETFDHAIPIDVLLRGKPLAWVNQTVVPHYRKTFGNCFVVAKTTPALTAMRCPSCGQEDLTVESV